MLRMFCLLVASLLCVTVFADISIAENQEETLSRYRALGQAYMENEDFENAIDAFQQTTALRPTSASDVINLGIAHYHGDKNDESIRILTDALTLDAHNPFAHYTLGLAYKKMGQSEKAVYHFGEVAKQDQTDPPTMYNLGLALSKIKRNDEAADCFHKTLQLDPKHSSSVYRLLLHARIHLKDMKLAMEYNKQFQALKKNEEQRPATAIDEGKFLGPIEFDIPADLKPKFTSDVNFTWVKKALTTPYPNGIRYPADFDNDSVVEELWLKDGVLHLENLTVGDSPSEQPNPIPAVTDINHAHWSDYDHDGDLDLFLARPIHGDKLFQNNADGSFSEITDSVKGFNFGKSYSIITTDLDNDNDLDIICLDVDENLISYINQREVTFKQNTPVSLQLTNTKYRPQIKAEDINNNGFMEIMVLAPTHSGLPCYQFDLNERTFAPLKSLMLDEKTWITALADFNNDGFDDAVLATESKGQKIIQSIMLNQHPLDAIVLDVPFPISSIHEAIPIDLDRDGDMDLLVKTDKSTTLLENKGGNSNASLTLNLIGNKNTADGYGSKILIKDGLFRVKKEVTSPQTHIGLGDRKSIDVMRVTWPNGIFQNEVHVALPQIKSVTEKPGYAGSCPFVYTWNGERYEFIADALSVGPLGLYVGHGDYFPPDPDETIRIRSDQLMPRDGSLEIMIREELREITYLDKATLISASHPDAVAIFVNERFTIPPVTEFQLIGQSTKARPVKKVTDHLGNDVTNLIIENDLNYPHPFTKGHYYGIGKEHWFEIDPGDISGSENVFLYMTGYVDWPNSSHSRALEQNSSLDFVMPYLQVKNTKGEWQTVLNPMGNPAGKLKTITLDISDIFLSNDHTLRIVSTVQVYWDQILVDPSPILDGFIIEHYPLRSAELRYGGYAKEYNLGELGPHWYDYNQRTTNFRWDYHRGDFTHYGDVMPLLNAFDDQYIIMQHGDEVAARFADVPNSHDSQSLTWFLTLTGWVKDLDPSTAFSQNVDPLPFKAMSAYPYGEDESYPLTDENLLYIDQYNTREIHRQNEPLVPVLKIMNHVKGK